MTIRLYMSGEAEITSEAQALLERAAVQTVAHVPSFAALLQDEELIAAVELSLVDDQKMEAINTLERQIARTTDVLSFPLLQFCEGELQEALADYHLTDLEADFPTLPLGAIVISLPRAEAQASEYGHSFLRELVFLFVHGLLHLLGYDHHTPAEEETMRQKQRAILARLNLERREGEDES